MPDPIEQRITNDEAGELDEVVITTVEHVHLERMDEGAWWLAIYLPGGERIVVCLASNRPGKTLVRGTVTERPEGWPVAR